MIELGHRLHDLGAAVDLVEARDGPVGAGNPDHAHAERLAARREPLGDGADAENADGLAEQQRAGETVPPLLHALALDAAEVAGERQHVQERHLGDRLAVDAAHRGDDHVLAEKG